MSYRIQQVGTAVGIVALAFGWYGLLTGDTNLVTNGLIVSLTGFVATTVGRYVNV